MHCDTSLTDIDHICMHFYSNTLINVIYWLQCIMMFQVRDEYRTDYDEGRGGYGIIVKQKHQYRPLARPVP